MSIFRVYLSESGHGVTETVPPSGVTVGSSLERQYRGFFASPQWLVGRPVRVRLWSRQPSRREALQQRQYELDLVVSTPPRRRQGKAAQFCGRAAALAVATLALSSAAEARGVGAPMSIPPCVQHNDRRLRVPSAPPQVGLRHERRTRQVTSLLDERGTPVLLGAFHSNSTGGVGTHQNSVAPHTNTPVWSNHSNAFHPATSVPNWTNHANIPANTIQHANVTPGDFVF